VRGGERGFEEGEREPQRGEGDKHRNLGFLGLKSHGFEKSHMSVCPEDLTSGIFRYWSRDTVVVPSTLSYIISYIRV